VMGTSIPRGTSFSIERTKDHGNTTLLWCISNLAYRPFVNRKVSAY
jgi:hypothetical protein